MSKPTCFIIMPLTTPARYVELYKGDTHHFIHVLDELFMPAIEAAGMKPIRPIVEGSEVIHGEIIRNLTDADLVLCDMTIFNPNVFFELGIRTALNKPISMIMDDFTDKTPFDLAPVNYHKYDSSLTSWVIKAERECLKNHIEACMKNGFENALWKYFSMSAQAELPSDAPDMEKQIAYLIKQVESLREQTSNQRPMQLNDLSKADKIVGTISLAETLTLPELFKLFRISNTEEQRQSFMKELFMLKDMGSLWWDGEGLNEKTKISVTNKKKHLSIGDYLLS